MCGTVCVWCALVSQTRWDNCIYNLVIVCPNRKLREKSVRSVRVCVFVCVCMRACGCVRVHTCASVWFVCVCASAGMGVSMGVSMNISQAAR